jgi:hypothetical protein
MTKNLIVCAVAGLLLAGAGSASATPIVSIQPSASTVSPGDLLTLEIDIADVSDLFAFQFDVAFDPTVLVSGDVTEGAFLPAGGTTLFIPGAVDNVAGSITGTANALFGLAGVNGSGPLAQIALNALAVGTSPITLSNVILVDSSLNDIPFTLASGTVEVHATSSVPEPATLMLVSTAGLTLLLRRKRVLKTACRRAFTAD